MADRYKTLVGGKDTMREATVSSTGAAEAGDIVGLDASGKIDISLLPTGVGPSTKDIVAFEALGAGDYVNIFDNGGVANVRLADNSNGREADGFVLSAFAPAATATVYTIGSNTAVTGKTIGARQYLGTAGATIETPLDPDVDTGSIHQFLGKACEATSIETNIDDCTLL